MWVTSLYDTLSVSMVTCVFQAVTSVLMHPQSDLIMVSASLDKSVRLWNLETFEEIYKLVPILE